MESTPKPAVIIADIQYLVTEGLNSLLRDYYAVKGIATGIDEIIELLKTEKPQLLFIEPDSPFLDDHDHVKQMKANFPETCFIIITDTISPKDIRSYIRSGINNILDKFAGPDEILDCAEAAIKGRKYLSAAILDLMLDDREDLHSHGSTELTASEKEIVKMIAGGFTSREIALKRNVSIHTIMAHRKNIFRKTGVTNVSGLLIFAFKEGLLDVIDYQI